MRNYDITILGAGMIGASLACAIAQADGRKQLSIALVDSQTEFPQFAGENFDPRVVALTHASQKFLQQLGVWSDIETKRICAYSDMHVWDGEGTASIHFDAKSVGASALGHIVENSVVVNSLQQKIQEHSQINFIRPARILDVQKMESIGIVLDQGEPFTTSLVIAADGARSSLREMLGFQIREWEYGHQAIVATVEIELAHQQTAWQRFMHTGPLAFLPLPDVNGKHFCSIVWSAENSLAEKLMSLSDAEFCIELTKAFETRLGVVKSTSERFAYPLKQRHAKHYIQEGVALVGDAAHTIHPLAGQGANLGFMDAQVLATEIARALERNLPMTEFSILRRYQRQRLGHNLGMMTAMEGFKQLFAQRSPGWNGLRNFGMRQLDSQTVVKKIIIQQAMGL